MTYGAKVDVYWNLNKKKWSVRHKGIVVSHEDNIYIQNAKFVVQPAGNAKVRKNKQKNVHAFVRGIISDNFSLNNLNRIKYNPYKYKSFVTSDEKPIYSADKVYLDSSGACYGD